MLSPPTPFLESHTRGGHNGDHQAGDEECEAQRKSGILVTQLANKSQSWDLKSRLRAPVCTVPTVPSGPMVSQEVEAGLPGGGGTCREEVEGQAQGLGRACFWRLWSRSTVWQSRRLKLLTIQRTTMQPVLSQEKPFVIMLHAQLSFVIRDFHRRSLQAMGPHLPLGSPPPPRLFPCALWTKG